MGNDLRRRRRHGREAAKRQDAQSRLDPCISRISSNGLLAPRPLRARTGQKDGSRDGTAARKGGGKPFPYMRGWPAGRRQHGTSRLAGRGADGKLHVRDTYPPAQRGPVVCPDCEPTANNSHPGVATPSHGTSSLVCTERRRTEPRGPAQSQIKALDQSASARHLIFLLECCDARRVSLPEQRARPRAATLAT